MSTYAEYLDLVEATMAVHGPDWRQGQAAFNALCKVSPILAEEVRGSLRDPFYQDSRLDAFYEYVELNWVTS
jgi:hypothetical protein